LGQAIIVLIGVTIVTFILLELLNLKSGGIARAIVGARAPQSEINAFNHQYGFDRPFWVPLWKYVVQLLHGNLGYSYHYNQSVDSVIANEIPRDLVLGGLSLIFSLVIAIPVGVAQAIKRNKIVDHTATTLSFILYSMPPYAVALLLIQLFSISLHVFPAEAPQGSWLSMLGHPNGLVLPVVSLTLVSYAYFSRYMRSSAIETLAQDYIRTARAKGLSERLVLSRHLLRNSLLTIITLIGLSIPVIITGTVITEYVFNFPGVGLEYFNSAQSNDFEVMVGITMLIGLITVLGNLVSDIGYALLDPRIRY
jgi:peptide/nickel transport system permease protein